MLAAYTALTVDLHLAAGGAVHHGGARRRRCLAAPLEPLVDAQGPDRPAHRPFYTTYLYYPQGVSLLFHTLVPLESALTVPFQLLGVDLLPLYNGVLACSFVLAGYGTWLLVRDLTRNDGAAFVAGFAFAFCPYHMGHLLGHMNLASLQWIPFYLWALFRACGRAGHAAVAARARPAQGGAWGGRPLAGLFLVANALTEWIYVAFLGVFTARLPALAAAGRYARPRRAGGPGRAWPARLLLLGAVFGVLAGPLLVRTALARRGQDWMRFPPRETLVYSSDLVDSFVPSALHPFWPDRRRRWSGTCPRATRPSAPSSWATRRCCWRAGAAAVAAPGALASGGWRRG